MEEHNHGALLLADLSIILAGYEFDNDDEDVVLDELHHDSL